MLKQFIKDPKTQKVFRLSEDKKYYVSKDGSIKFTVEMADSLLGGTIAEPASDAGQVSPQTMKSDGAAEDTQDKVEDMEGMSEQEFGVFVQDLLNGDSVIEGDVEELEDEMYEEGFESGEFEDEDEGDDSEDDEAKSDDDEEKLEEEFEKDGEEKKDDSETKSDDEEKKDDSEEGKDKVMEGAAEALEQSIAKAATDSMDKMDESFKKEIVALVAGGEVLAEESAEKVITVFQAAVAAKVKSIVEAVQADAKAVLENHHTALKKQQIEAIDAYLKTVVESWVKKNEAQIQKAIQAQTAVNAMNEVAVVLAKHGISSNKTIKAMVEGLNHSNAQLKAALLRSINTSKKLSENLEGINKDKVVAKLTEGMVESQKEKLVEMFASIQAKDLADFEKKATVISEAFHKSTSTDKTVVEAKVVNKDAVQSLIEAASRI